MDFRFQSLVAGFEEFVDHLLLSDSSFARERDVYYFKRKVMGYLGYLVSGYSLYNFSIEFCYSWLC